METILIAGKIIKKKKCKKKAPVMGAFFLLNFNNLRKYNVIQIAFAI